jgi:hypothetical protein
MIWLDFSERKSEQEMILLAVISETTERTFRNRLK